MKLFISCYQLYFTIFSKDVIYSFARPQGIVGFFTYDVERLEVFVCNLVL